MPNINLTDSRKRDAVIKAESTAVSEDTRLVDANGDSAATRKILKASIEHDHDTLIARHEGDSEKLALSLIDTDPEVDIEKCGLFLWGVSRVYVNSEDGIVYRIEQFDNVRAPDGELRERRPRQRAEPNVDSDIPLSWTGRKIKRQAAATRFLFTTKLQIVHINGLTYDFLYGMAQELAESDSMMMVGGGAKGRDPLVFRRGSIPYRGFLEGRIQGDRYILLLHLSNMELKLPESADGEDQQQEQKPARKPRVSEEQAQQSEQKKKKKAAKKDSTDAASEGAKKDAAYKPEKAKPASAKSTARKDTQPENTAAGSDDTTLSNEDLGVWLKSVRMGKYLQLFIDNEIDVDVLPELTDDDLKELDIPVGSRRRLLAAVAATDNLRAEVAMAVSKMSASGKSARKTSKAGKSS